MPKQKFNTTDVAAECAELRRLVVGSWLSNIYDLDDKKTFLLKFSKSGGRTESGEGEKTVLLLESGCRFHTTTYRRERKQDTPSKLNQKLRMHLRGKRLNGVNQLGNDRCVEFVFGAGDTKHSLVLELYAQGNLVLLDANDKILTLLRPVRDDKNGLVLLGNHAYDRTRFRLRKRTTREELENALEFGDCLPVRRTVSSTPFSGSSGTTVTDTSLVQSQEAGDTQEKPRAPKTLREALCRAFQFSPQTADMVCVLSGLLENGGQTGLPLTGGDDDKRLVTENLLTQLHVLEGWFDSLETPEDLTEAFLPGYVEETFSAAEVLGTSEIEKIDSVDPEKTYSTSGWRSESFSPFPFSGKNKAADSVVGDVPGTNPVPDGREGDAQPLTGKTQNPETATRARHHPSGFDKAVDEHFASLEKAADFRTKERLATNASKKTEKIKKDQQRRQDELDRELTREQQKAELIEYNLEVVDNVLSAVNALLSTGQSWDEIGRTIEDEKRNGNPVARLVKKLDLANNSVTVGLVNHLDTVEEGDGEDEEKDEEEKDGETDVAEASASASASKEEGGSKTPKKKRGKKHSLAVTLDLSLSAYANAREHHARRKKHEVKLTKTVNQNERALLASKAQGDGKKKQDLKNTKTGMTSMRTPEWFEKFHWFVTTEGCLVLSARDQSQCDLLIKKYLGPHDAFVKADVVGAPATVVKAPAFRNTESDASDAQTKKEQTDDKADPTENTPSSKTSSKCLVPPVSLAQAGQACLCRSSAWDSRNVISAWWVSSAQVRKETPGGDPLAPGVVWTVGQKNFLPPAPLVMGFAFLFLVETEEDVRRHVGDRTVKTVLSHADTSSSIVEQEESAQGVSAAADELARLAIEATKKKHRSRLESFLDASPDTELVDPTTRGTVDETGVSFYGTDPVDDESDRPSDKNKTGGARISASQRRAMKKQRKKGDATAETADKMAEHVPKPCPKPSNPVGKQSQPSQTQKSLPRGAKKKAQRAAAKYAEQDEEDKEIALGLLGVCRMSKQSGSVTQKSGGSEGGEEREKDVDVTSTDTSKENQSGDDEYATLDDDVLAADSDDDEDSVSEVSGRTEKTGNAPLDVLAFVLADKTRVQRIDWFTGCPHLEDGVTHAVAMVAPFDALKQFAYKAKLTPGSQKKGKAAKTALDVILKAPPSVGLIGSAGGEASKDTDKFSAKGDTQSSKVADTDAKGDTQSTKGDAKSDKDAKAARAARDAFLKSKISAAANALAAGDLAQIMCGQGIKVSMPAGAAKTINAQRKGKK